MLWWTSQEEECGEGRATWISYGRWWADLMTPPTLLEPQLVQLWPGLQWEDQTDNKSWRKVNMFVGGGWQWSWLVAAETWGVTTHSTGRRRSCQPGDRGETRWLYIHIQMTPTEECFKRDRELVAGVCDEETGRSNFHWSLTSNDMYPYWCMTISSGVCS